MGNILKASKINLSNQNLSEIPSFIFHCRNLRELNLSNNNLSSIPRELFTMKRLRKLDLSNNRLTSIYANIALLENLEVINLNGNKLQNIPTQLYTLKALKKLLLGNNKLEILSEELSNLEQVRYLNIANNSFEDFPEIILKLKNLERLWLNNNNFKSIPLEQLKINLEKLKGIYFYSPQIYNKSDSNQILFDTKGNAKKTLDLITYNNYKLTKETSMTVVKDMIKSIFISYSHKDSHFKEEVEISLKGLKNVIPDLEFTYWSDTQIKPGSKWEREIKDQLENCSIAIMLVSRHFLASEFIMNTEVPTLLSKLEHKGGLILSLILGKCLFEKSSLRVFQALNSPSMPLNSLTPHEQELVYFKLEETINDYFNPK